MVVVLDPSAVIELDTATMVDVIGLTDPGTKFTVSVSVIAGPFNVPVMVAIPVVTADVSVAV